MDALRPLADPAAVQAEAARLLGTYLGVNRSTYAEIDGECAVLRGRYSDGVPPLPDRLPLAAFGGLVDESRRGRMVAIDDVRSDARVSEAALAAFDAIHMRAFVTVVLIKDGRWVAAFGVDAATPRAWTDARPRADSRGRRTHLGGGGAGARRGGAARERGPAPSAVRDDGEGFAVGELVRDACGEPIDWRFMFVNAALERSERPATDDVVGRLGSEIFPMTIATGCPSSRKSSTRSGRGARARQRAHGRVWSSRFYPYGDDRYAGAVSRHHGRRRAEEAQRTQREAPGLSAPARRRAAAAPRRGRHPVEAARTLGEQLQVDCVHYVELDEANDRIHIARVPTSARARAA